MSLELILYIFVCFVYYTLFILSERIRIKCNTFTYTDMGFGLLMGLIPYVNIMFVIIMYYEYKNMLEQKKNNLIRLIYYFAK